MEQLIKTCKPLVDTISNCEAWDASLASCMLELIRAARKMSQIPLDLGNNSGFWMHVKHIFNCRFHTMNTDHHVLTLYLHPMCRKLATSQVANGRNFEFMVLVALLIAQQWRWDEAEAKSLVQDLKEYHRCTGVFAGAQADALKWWEQLPVTTQQCPLKTMAVVHAADVERYFSRLGDTQSVKRCNLTVETFKGLNHAAGKSVHRKHAHMHTQTKPGIDASLAEDLTKNFTWVPPLTTQSEPEDDYLAGPEAVTDEELSSAFDALDHEKQDTSVLATNSYLGTQVDPELELDGNKVLEGQVYTWKELEVVDKGSLLMGFAEDILVLNKAGDGNWDIQALLSSEGVAF
ncbi:hypothetical protein L210DRAFT_3502066 [Boletus edulis BED1]|uniref:Uncharacterized protein n=1 Tax=Boletus edulis BED1 TaxID=1328754 RepID=A0AAD4GHK8_BOLED|nr:hypothetical protein L210DRAFT_3502066 [Boletus edulis BED1]